jgi:hypothetical protein
MTLLPGSNGDKQPRARRARNQMPLAAENSKEAKRWAVAILEVLGGVLTPQQASTSLGMSLPRYYQMEARALQALLGACETKPRGRQPDPRKEITQLQRENERLQRELNRQQSLVRMARSIGLPPVPPTPPNKANGKKSRKRKPVRRALTLAARLAREAATETPGDTSSSPAT